MDEEFDELKREFLAEADAKIREIASSLPGLGDGPSGTSHERMSYLAHQLKGAGGSYGFQRISTEAAALENALERVASGEPDSKITSDIELCIRNLSTEIVDRSRELGAAPEP